MKSDAFRVWNGHPCFEDATVPLVDGDGREQLYVVDGNFVRVHPDRREAFDAMVDGREAPARAG